MKHTTLSYVAVLAVAITVCSCSVTRHIPAGSYMLEKNVIETDRSVPKSERLTSAELERFVRQNPSKKFLGTNLFLWIYGLSNPDNNNKFNKLLRRVGVAPVILDTTQSESSVVMMKNYMDNSGFFNSSEYYTLDTAKRKATVTYHTHQGQPYRIGTISYIFKDRSLQPVICQDTAASLIHSGDIFNQNTLEAERTRITNDLRNKGYYLFTVNNIRYLADSTVGNHTINLKMEVQQYLSGYNSNGTPIMSNNTVYRLKNIYINPDYEPVVAATDSSYYNNLDTMEYRGLNIIYRDKPRVRKGILRQTVNLYPNYLYSSSQVKHAYANIMRLGFYKTASILFSEVKDTTAQNIVTFIGNDNQTSDSTTEQVTSTTEDYLNCSILCTPALRQSYKIELEYSTTSDFNKIGATIGYQNRNLFRGAELFDVSFTGAYELMRVKGKKSSFEVGGAISMSFPRFITPFKVDRFNRLINPQTKVEVSINSQRRPYYHRTLSGINWGYSWSNRHHSNFTLRPIDVSLVKMGYINTQFRDSLPNLYLRNSYISQLIAGISGSYVYNNQVLNSNANSLLFRLNIETTGNLLSGVAGLISGRSNSDDPYKIFGVPFSQYVRADASVSNKIAFGAKTALVYRFYAGGGVAYGNSTSLPFDRMFYSGGSNSMRGWMVRTLGPGTVLRPTDPYHVQLGNMRLEANLEARFPVWGMLHGAVFFDLGNIWFMNKSDSNPEAVFHFDNFYRQLGFNTGLGARFDLNFIIVRLDWGIKLHDPNMPMGQRWINNFQLKNTALHFAVGYPF